MPNDLPPDRLDALLREAWRYIKMAAMNLNWPGEETAHYAGAHLHGATDILELLAGVTKGEWDEPKLVEALPPGHPTRKAFERLAQERPEPE